MTRLDLALARIQTLLIRKLNSADFVHHRLGFGVAFVDAKHLLVVNEDLRWQAFDDPRVHEGVERCDTFFRIPLEALADEIVERVALAHQNLVERF